LAAQHGNLLFIFLLETHLGLFHLIDLLADHLHLLHLSLDLMLVSLGLPNMRFELGPDLIEKLIQTAGTAIGRGDAPHTPMAGIHRHGG